MRELFIYWRVAADRAGAALAATVAFQDVQRRQHPGLHAAIYRRAGDAAGAAVTMMETYAASPPATANGQSAGANPVTPAVAAAAEAAGIDSTLQSALVAAGADALGPWCQDGRHVEAFDRITAPR